MCCGSAAPKLQAKAATPTFVLDQRPAGHRPSVRDAVQRRLNGPRGIEDSREKGNLTIVNAHIAADAERPASRRCG